MSARRIEKATREHWLHRNDKRERIFSRNIFCSDYLLAKSDPCLRYRAYSAALEGAPGAFGDLFAVVLAWVALILLRRPAGYAALWLFNLWGAGDLLFAFYQGLFDADFHPSALGATFYIPTVYVPLLLCVHFMLFALLLRARSMSTNAAAGS